jgi:pimeloyl-ACP methyl ester carboxylesterase
MIGDASVSSILERMGARMEEGATERQRAAYGQHFDRLDADRDGRHSVGEYVANGSYLTPQARRGIFSAADANKDEFVSRAEYILNRIITDEAKGIMQALDADQDGAVGRTEFVKGTKKRLGGVSRAGSVFDALDTSGDGVARVPEYLRVWGQWARVGRGSAEKRLAGGEGGLLEKVHHGYAQNGGVKIHYASIGEGPLVVMIHGFPDYWYTWREQMTALSKAGYRVVAIDQRGYNRSDKPKGVDQYAMTHLVEDVAAVVKACGSEKAIICGHDWGGAVAWTLAMMKPGLVEKLIVLNLPHPRGLARELAINPEQRKNSAYARRFQEPGAHEKLTAEGLAGWVKDPQARARYIEAFKRSDFEAMLNYYKKNYPRPPYREPAGQVIRINCPVLLVHGLDDQALLPGALNDTWEWLGGDLTLVTIPRAGHFVQQDAADLVSRTMKMWLGR